METQWELRESGPVGAAQTVLLLPGGMCGAGSWAEVVAEPRLAGVRIVAATVPGNAGAPPPDDYRIEQVAGLVGELATKVGADVIVGFSLGAAVAVELVASGRFSGPTVLLGVSLSAKDEPAFFRGIVRLGGVFGGAPSAMLAKGAASMVKKVSVSEERRDELRADFARNDPHHMRSVLREYVAWLHRSDHRVDRLCASDVPLWVAHAEHGDGALTDEERRTLGASSNVHVLTIPGRVLLIPNEVPERVTDLLLDAIAAVA